MKENKIQERKVTITFPLFPHSFNDVVGELVNIGVDFCYTSSNSSIQTKISDDVIASLEQEHQVSLDVQLTESELKEKVMIVLQKQIDDVELDYPLVCITETDLGEKITEIVSIGLDEDDDETIRITFNNGHTGYYCDLDEDTKVELLQNVLDQYNSSAFISLEDYTDLLDDITDEYAQNDHDVYSPKAKWELREYIQNLVKEKQEQLKAEQKQELVENLWQDFIYKAQKHGI